VPEERVPEELTAGSSGLSAADSLRENWDGVLAAVKQERRVAWMLLSNASVLSLQDGILTLRFPRDGDLKGFSVSGHDAVLRRVLSASFGLNVMVKGVTGGDAGSAATGLTPGGPSSGSSGSVRSLGSSGPLGSVRSSGSSGPPGPGSGSGTGRQPAPARPAAGPSESATPEFATPASAGHHDEMPDDMPPDEVQPDEPSADDSAARSAELTGMDLIQRELGGQVIGEIEG
jgi:DNA polymerase-3 subunit gamma/tau